MKKIISVLLAVFALAGTTSIFAKDAEPVPEVVLCSMNPYQTTKLKQITFNVPTEELVIVKAEASGDSAPSTTIDVKIECNYRENLPIVTFNEKSLVIDQKDKNIKKLNGYKCKITVTLPGVDYCCPETTISMGTKSLNITNGTFDRLTVNGSTGLISLNQVTAANLTIDAASARCVANKLAVSNTLSFTESNSETTFTNTDANTYSVKVEKGKFSALNTTAKNFSLNVERGSSDFTFLSVPETSSSVKLGSGSVSLKFPVNSVFWTSTTVEKKGRFTSEFTQDSAGPLVTLKVGSGSLAIKQNIPNPVYIQPAEY